MPHGRLLTTTGIASWLLLFGSIYPAGLLAAPPTIEKLSVHGLQSGGETAIAVDGTNLTADCRLFVHGAAIGNQQIEPGATAKQLKFKVAIDSSTSPGIFELRVVSPEGISNPLPVAVDSLAQIPWREKVESLPAALSGNLAGNQTLSTTFTAKKNQAIVLDVEAQRIGSQLRPVLQIYDDRHVQVAWASATSSLGEDARVVFQPPADGTYTAEIHDSRYEAKGAGHFRLKIGAFEFADIALPAAVQCGARQVLHFANTNLPPDAAAEFVAPQVPLRFPAAWPVRPGLCGLRPTIMVTEERQLLEMPTAADHGKQDLQSLPFPGGVTGRLSKPREQDRYRLSAAAGKKLRLTLSAQRLGSPLDGALSVLGANGEELASADDGNRTTDPTIDFTFPKDTESVTLVVKDVLRRGGADFVYHLAAKAVDEPDFSLSFEEDRLQIPPRGNVLLKVQAKRIAGFNGAIRLRLTGLPAGIQVAEGEIPAGSDVGFCLLSATGMPATFSVANIFGEAEGPDGAMIRQAVGPASGAAASCPWLHGDLGVAVTANPAPFSIELAMAADQLPNRLPLGGSIDLPLTIDRNEKATGAVKLSIVSTQPGDGAMAATNRNRRGRRGRPANKPAENKTIAFLRLDDDEPIAPTTKQTTATVLVPPELSLQDYGLVIRGDLLAEDGKTVAATAYTRPRWLKAVIPFSVTVEKANLQVRAGEGETGELAGTIKRTDGFAGEVSLTLQGLPQGVIAPIFHVPAGESDFKFLVSLQYGVKPGTIRCKLTSSAKAYADESDKVISGPATNMVLNVVQGEKPKMEKPLALFEDSVEVLNELAKGEGVLAIYDQDKYSGNIAVMARNQVRYSESLPNLGVKIRENPGPGEYRYVRFAWKGVRTAESVRIHFFDDGKQEPNRGKLSDFAYQAGAGPAAAEQLIMIDNNGPKDWAVVTRDLFADFGEFTLTGYGVGLNHGKPALYDHVYLGRHITDLDNVDAEASPAVEKPAE